MFTHFHPITYIISFEQITQNFLLHYYFLISMQTYLFHYWEASLLRASVYWCSLSSNYINNAKRATFFIIINESTRKKYFSATSFRSTLNAVTQLFTSMRMKCSLIFCWIQAVFSICISLYTIFRFSVIYQLISSFIRFSINNSSNVCKEKINYSWLKNMKGMFTTILKWNFSKIDNKSAIHFGIEEKN